MATRTATEIAITIGFLGVVGAGAGCAPSLSTFQAASVAPKGHFTAEVGFEGGIPVGAIDRLIDTGKTLSSKAQSQMALTPEEKWQVFDTGVNLVLESPSIGPHFGVTYTVIDRLEVGIRYAGTAWRGGVRYQILDHTRGPFDLTAGVGVAHFSYEFPIPDIPILKIDDFSRWQVDVPVLIGTSRDWFRVWAGPKVLFTSFDTAMTLTIPGMNDVTVAKFDGTAVFFGGQGGLALGYRRLFLAMELTMMEATGTAHLSAPALSAMTRDTAVSSFTIFPSIGLMGEI